MRSGVTGYHCNVRSICETNENKTSAKALQTGEIPGFARADGPDKDSESWHSRSSEVVTSEVKRAVAIVLVRLFVGLIGLTRCHRT